MKENLISILKERFDKTLDLHPNSNWDEVEEKLLKDKKLLETLCLMEETGGEVNFVDLPIFSGPVFLDCAKESPKGRRSLCYDKEARIKRKKNAPNSSVMEEAEKIGIKVLNEDQYYTLQELFEFDLKSSSWILTEGELRERGGALFCEKRYGRVFTFHNGAESYYSSRGFRGYVEI
ncbi:DUF4256 domain-containing protein [Anaerococcus sp. Marseille-Q7828]|uniref:DUF4256 domain-containing protein n=1 Tax=Anaerococcus sp. Marseille-Q7828 TaxID=3036300 RepID=UPI0024ADDECD|nr:DUF4256 domain-containing protein [Anaerococcus sp. Marseille-Q7828]